MRTLRTALAVLLMAPVALAAVAFAPAAAQAQSINVAIFPLNGFSMGGDDGPALAASMRDMLMTEFAQNAKVKMVDRNSMDQLIKSRQLSLSGKLSEEQVMQIGGLLGAQYGLSGGIFLDKKNARIDLHITDIETGEISNPYKETVSRDDLLSMVPKVATFFSGDLKLKARVAEVVIPIPSVFAYTRGLDYEKRGDKAKAAAMYESALKIFPDNAAAKTALSRVK